MRTTRYTCVSLALAGLLSVASSAKAASFLVQESGQWAKPGVPLIAFHDERPDSPTSFVGRYDNAINGDKGKYRLSPLSPISYKLELISDKGGPAPSVRIFWDPKDPRKYDQEGWGIMYLIP